MILIFTFLDDKNVCRVSHGLDVDTDRIVILPTETLSYYQAAHKVYWNRAICEWVMPDE